MAQIDDQIAAALANYNAVLAENERLKAQIASEVPSPESRAALAKMAAPSVASPPVPPPVPATTPTP